MAIFVKAQSPKGTEFVINADQVRYVRQSSENADQCTLVFGSDDYVVVGISASDFELLAHGVK